MSSQPIRWRRLATGAMVAVLMAGCGDGSDPGPGSGTEPATYATVKDGAAFDAIRTEVGDVFREAAEAADHALGGDGLRGDDAVTDTLCNEAYPRRFSRLKAGVTFVAPGASVATALQRVADAWTRPGWKVEVLEPDRISLSAKTSDGVPFGVELTLQTAQDDGALAGGLSLSTRCLKLPEDVADGL